MVDVLADRRKELDQAIVGLYAAFPRRASTHVDGFPLYAGFASDRTPRLCRAGEFPAEALQQYQWRAMTTWGGVEDFRTFVPRLLECVATVTPGTIKTALIEPWLVFGKLNYGEWPRWPVQQRNAVEAYLQRIWRWVLAHPVELTEEPWVADRNGWITDWIQSIARAVPDLDWWLRAWRTDVDGAENARCSAAHLAVAACCEQRFTDAVGSDDSSRAIECQLTTWLGEPWVLDALEREFHRSTVAAEAEWWSKAHQLASVAAQRRASM